MTIRYLAMHSSSASAAAKRASKPGVSTMPANKPAQIGPGPNKPEASKPIRKRPKRPKTASARDAKRDFKSSQLSLKPRIRTTSASKNAKNMNNQSSKRSRKSPVSRTGAGSSSKKCFVEKAEVQNGHSRVAALASPALRLIEQQSMVPTVSKVMPVAAGHDCKQGQQGQNSRNAVSNQRAQTVNTQPCVGAGTQQWPSQFTSRGCKLQRLPIPVHIEEFFEYGGKAVCSNHVFNFKIVENESDLITEDKPFFNPKFTHQIYNSDETLRGHDEPSIEIFLSPSTLTPYLNWTTRCSNQEEIPMIVDDKQPLQRSIPFKMMLQQQGLTTTKSSVILASCMGTHQHKEDDIAGKLQETFENSLITDRNAFIKIVRNENKRFRPLGKFITEFTRNIEVKKPNSLFSGLETAAATKRPKREVQQTKGKASGQNPATITKVFKVYRVNAQQVTFTHLNSHLQAILKFYIESASFIPLDPFWHYFLVYMDNKLVAYATTFDEFLKVPKAPLTISQVLVLPPYQKFGIGSTLLEYIYSYYLRVQKCLSMIVEDPADDFQRMKDALDIKMILRAGFFRSIRGLGLGDPKKMLKQDSFKMCGLDHREINEIRTKLKLKKENIQRCFELLQIACLEDDADLHEAYRKYVLRKFTESRDLLLPYFKFENFAEQSMYSFNNKQLVRQDCRIVEKCCLGNGQLSCMVGRVRQPYESPAADGPLTLATMANGAAAKLVSQLRTAERSEGIQLRATAALLGSRSPPPTHSLLKPYLSLEVPVNSSSSRNKPVSDTATGTGGGMNVSFNQKDTVTAQDHHNHFQNVAGALGASGAPTTALIKRTPALPQVALLSSNGSAQPPGISSTVLRANRFTPTPWQEIHGAQVRYKVPATLQTKIRIAITQFVPLIANDSSASSSSSWSRNSHSKSSRK